jgi:hypothetical protein
MWQFPQFPVVISVDSRHEKWQGSIGGMWANPTMKHGPIQWCHVAPWSKWKWWSILYMKSGRVLLVACGPILSAGGFYWWHVGQSFPREDSIGGMWANPMMKRGPIQWCHVAPWSKWKWNEKWQSSIGGMWANPFRSFLW